MNITDSWETPVTDDLDPTDVLDDLGHDDTNTLDADAIMQNIYLAIGILGMTDNSFVAMVLMTSREMRGTTTNMFIINQSMIDFSASFFIVVTNFFRDVTHVPPGLEREMFCRLWLTNLPIWGFFISSTYNLVCMTLERYYALVHPLKHAYNFTKKKAGIMFAFSWVIGPGFYMTYTVATSYMQDENTCSVINKWPGLTWQRTAGILITTFQYFIPLVIICYCYTRIILVLKRGAEPKSKERAGKKESSASSNRDNLMLKAKKNVIKTLLLVALCFVFCWSWNQVYYLMFNLGQNVSFNTPFYHFTVLAIFCNCSLNPIVYAIKYEQFQRRVVELFCCCCRNSSMKPSTSDVSITRNTDVTVKGSEADSELEAGHV